VILGHINLAPIGIMIKALFPAKKIVLITHGIEIWDKLNAVKTLLLKKADTVLAVSNFTKEKISLVHKVDRQKIRVFANTLDPSFVFPKQFNKPLYLQERYKIRKHNRILLTIARLSYAEKYKGYDKVIEVLPALLEKDPNLLYVIGGKADQQEKERLNKLIEKDGLENNVMILGFIPDHELMDHYLLADLFVMPSKGEGFGIVFIEAMACGLPVIGGNEDGSVDALANGEFGLLVKPGDQMELVRAIEKQLHLSVDKQALQSKVLSRFGAQAYAQQVESLFSELSY
jgi:glycosyltransferase involved in cell wall biosynthesis